MEGTKCDYFKSKRVLIADNLGDHAEPSVVNDEALFPINLKLAKWIIFCHVVTNSCLAKQLVSCWTIVELAFLSDFPWIGF